MWVGRTYHCVSTRPQETQHDILTCRCGRPVSQCRAAPSPSPYRPGTFAPGHGPPPPAARGSGVSAPTSSRARVRCSLSSALLHYTLAKAMLRVRGFAHNPALYACHILVLPDSLSNPPEAVGHECGRAEQVHGWSEAAHGEVALVLDGVVPAHGGHILRHCGRSWCGCGGSMGGFGGCRC